MLNENDKREGIQNFRDIFMTQHKKLLKYAHLITEDREISQDVVQDAFTHAYKLFLNGYDSSEIVPTIYNIVRNRSMQYLKINSIEQPKKSVPEQNTNKNTNIHIITQRRHTYRKIINAINKLEPLYKEVIILKYYSCLSLDEIADIMNIKIGQVRQLIQEAKSEICKEFVNSDIEGERKWTPMKDVKLY